MCTWGYWGYWHQEVKDAVKRNDVARLKSVQKVKMLDFPFITVKRNGISHVDTPLTYAVRKGYTDIVKQLLCAGADVNYAAAFTPLMVAAMHGDFYICKLLLNSGANIHLHLNNHITALDYAVVYNNDRIVSFFVEQKALQFHSQEQLNKWLSLNTTLNFAIEGKRLGMSRIDGYSYTKRFLPFNESESDFRILKKTVQLTSKRKNQMFHHAEIFCEV